MISRSRSVNCIGAMSGVRWKRGRRTMRGFYQEQKKNGVTVCGKVQGLDYRGSPEEMSCARHNCLGFRELLLLGRMTLRLSHCLKWVGTPRFAGEFLDELNCCLPRLDGLLQNFCGEGAPS